MIKKIEKNDKVHGGFISFVLIALALLVIILVKGSYETLIEYKGRFGNIDILFIIITMIFFGLVYTLKRKKISNRCILTLIVIFGLGLRGLYALTIESVPISDFAIMFETAGEVLNGDFSKLWGSGYIARFPHITIPVMYFALIRMTFSDPLMVIKLINIIASTCNIVIIYMIIKEIFNDDRKAIVGSVITAIFPPLILYTAVFTTENIAIPLYLLGIYLFIKFVKSSNNNWKVLFFAAFILSLGNLFRMVAQIIVVAFILYIIVSYKDTIKKKVISIVIVLVGFMIPLVGVSFGLHYSGVIEYQLWKGSEPSLTNIVKGLNIEHNGRWNPEDAKIPDRNNFEYNKIEEECREVIWDRLSNTPKPELFKFFINKFKSQWSIGDFSGSYWAEHSVEEENIGLKFSERGIWFGQLLFFILICLAYIGLFNVKRIKENRSISLIYYIFCGYGLLYMVSENQARYGFIVSWLFILMSIIGVDLIQSFRRKG